MSTASYTFVSEVPRAALQVEIPVDAHQRVYVDYVHLRLLPPIYVVNRAKLVDSLVEVSV
eukprot:6708372-Pyramimonas_sp.AAC.1